MNAESCAFLGLFAFLLGLKLGSYLRGREERGTTRELLAQVAELIRQQQPGVFIGGVYQERRWLCAKQSKLSACVNGRGCTWPVAPCHFETLISPTSEARP